MQVYAGYAGLRRGQLADVCTTYFLYLGLLYRIWAFIFNITLHCTKFESACSWSVAILPCNTQAIPSNCFGCGRSLKSGSMGAELSQFKSLVHASVLLEPAILSGRYGYIKVLRLEARKGVVGIHVLKLGHDQPWLTRKGRIAVIGPLSRYVGK